MQSKRVTKKALADYVKPLGLNKQFRIVFQPYNREKYGQKRRFLIGSCNVAQYIGIYNAQSILSDMEALKDDKIRVKFRAHGIIDIYQK